jgi:hypothetical protein
MHFRVSEWMESVRQANQGQEEIPDEEFVCPYRVLDPATGSVISHVTEFNDDEGWIRVLCRQPQQFEGQTNFAYAHRDLDELVSQILYVPFQVVPYYDGIDDLPQIFLDTIDYNDGRPTGDWIPNSQPYTHHPDGES